MISVIITLYNYEKYIRDCLESCINQTYDDYEVVVVDDYSTDNSPHIVWQYQMRFPKKVKLLKHTYNKGFAEAKNTGIKASLGEFITFIDADDMLTRSSLKTRLEAIKNVDFVSGKVYDVTDVNLEYEDCLETTDRFKKEPGTQRYFKKEHRKKIHAQGMMFRRSVFEKHGLYWNILSKADKEMNYRLGIHPHSPLKRVIKAKWIDDFVAFYRRHPDSMKSALSERTKDELKKKFNNRIKQLKKEGITKENTTWL